MMTRTALCLRCKIVTIELTTSRKKYCQECAIKTEAERKIKSNYEKNMKRKTEKRLELDTNFYGVNPIGINLIPKNFDLVSSIKSQVYVTHFKVSWVKVLENYEKVENLIQTLQTEYVKFIEKTGSFSLTTAMKELGVNFLKDLNQDEIRELSGIRNENTNEESRKNNYFNVIKKLGRYPFTNPEFKKHTNITLDTYASNLKLTTNHLDGVAEYYLCEDEFENYKIEKQRHIKESRKEISLRQTGKFYTRMRKC